MDLQPITTFFETDHRRLDELFAQYRRDIQVDRVVARQSFKRYRSFLERHIFWEEKMMFPLFEEKMGFSGTGPTEVMRKEHALIEKYLSEIAQKLEEPDGSTVDEEQRLSNIMSLHNRKEEGILYPAIDRALTAVEWQEILAKIHASMKDEVHAN
jgi:iron-sulfur cluster repair protein YtfE (RIC family)